MHEVLPLCLLVSNCTLHFLRKPVKRNFQEEVLRRIITRDEMQLFSSKIEIQEARYLHELRSDFETKSKAQSSSVHSHKNNLSKTDIIDAYFNQTPIKQITQELI